MPLTTSILGRLKTQHETVQELVKGLSEEQLKQRVNPEKWSAFEQIAHLVAYQPTFLKRLQLIAHQETPVFERYLADNDPQFHQCLGYSLKELLEDFVHPAFSHQQSYYTVKRNYPAARRCSSFIRALQHQPVGRVLPAA